MSAKIDNSRGYVRISNNVISKLAGYAATNCYGVVGMAVKSGKDGIAKLLKRENMDKGVKVKFFEDGLEISLHIVVEYGINISTIGESIKNNVKYQVEEATGIDVKSVIVNVEGIRVNQ
ncbi:MAG TPA: Asp23/Gls24 family envelope stress response protein [Firmicutes bacterium]|nr:Asp23/Gls24 family envelope stress response protein [Bacillota bacterium]